MNEEILERLPRYSWEDLKKKIDSKTPFEALSPMGTMLLRVKEYRPLIGLAVHAGHRLREELSTKMGVDEDDRRYDEDTHSDFFIEDFPVQLIGLDSRYEYDIDRKREQAVYLKPFQCWGKKVWQTPPSKGELEISYQKYDEAHELIEFFVEQMLAYFHKAVVLDLHTYSYKRQMYGARSAALPLFNVGSSQLDRKKQAKILDALLEGLRKVHLPGIPVIALENDLFKGDGAVATHLVGKFPEAAVVPLDIKKVFMDETTGEIDDPLARKLRDQLYAIAQKLV
jgi:hypothetical protein